MRLLDREPTLGGARPRQLHDSWYLGKMQEGSTKGPMGARSGSREPVFAALGFLKYTTDHSDLVASLGKHSARPRARWERQGVRGGDTACGPFSRWHFTVLLGSRFSK